MSCYTCFFIRRENDFVPIGTYSRNSAVARAFNESNISAPWEKVSALTLEDINKVMESIEDNKKFDENCISKYQKKIYDVKGMDAPLSERLEAIEDYERDIAEIREDIEEWDCAFNFLGFLQDIIGEIKYSDYIGDEKYDINNYIYFGLEIGRPTVNDIVK